MQFCLTKRDINVSLTVYFYITARDAINHPTLAFFSFYRASRKSSFNSLALGKRFASLEKGNSVKQTPGNSCFQEPSGSTTPLW
jgi:hypothetical protein